MKSWKTPTLEQVAKAVALLGRVGHRRYFFDQLKNPLWIGPLKEKGFLSNPPPPEKDEAKGTIRFPLWPESKYLARMAVLAPGEVLTIILQLPDTDNTRVCEDLADAGLAMPANLAARLVGKAEKWICLPYQLLLPEKLGSLVAHLAKGGKVRAALGLARELLAVLPGESKGQPTEFSLPPEPRWRFEVWDYQEIVKRHVPVLIQSAGLEVFNLLCDLLEKAVGLSVRESGQSQPEDVSQIWRSAVEDHPQNSPSHGVKEILVIAVRDAAEQIAQMDATKVAELIRHLEARPWRIFHRIALHLLRKFPDADSNLLVKRLMNRRLFDESWARHEYALLLGENFGKLSQAQQQIILGWIEAGPGLRKEATRPPEEAEKIRKAWQCNRLAWIKASLPPQWKERYETLVKETGEPFHPDLVSYTTSWHGPTSPRTAEELKGISVDQVAAFLRTWQPPQETWTPSREGLGRVLEQVIAQDPREFADATADFCELDPTYVRHFIQGLEGAAKEDRPFEWTPVIELCHWVVERPKEIPGRKVSEDHLDADESWEPTRKAIGRLLHAGFKEGPACIPAALREKVWSVIEPLTQDLDPDTTRDAEMDSPTLSINSVRGEAMHAVVRYALWLRRSFESQGETERVKHGFSEMPEGSKVLEEHLDPGKESSLAIRSVYGQWFPWLLLLDRPWTISHKEQIFPTDESRQKLCDVAWETYVRFCNPYDEVLGVLQEQYAFAVDHLERRTASPPDKIADTERSLAEHLMTFAWRGKLALDRPDGLLARFWRKAPPELRAHAIEFIGRSMYHTEGAVPEPILERLRRLWTQRVNAVREMVAEGVATKELGGFGWWFASGKFDDKWALSELIVALELCGKMESDHFVVERLAKIASGAPLEAVQVLAALVDSDKEGWSISGWIEEARTILATARDSSDVATRETAENLIHRLGARGYLGFRDLLATLA